MNLQVLILPVLYFVRVSGQTINDTETLVTNLLSNYDRRVRPVYNQSSAIRVDISLYMKTIQEFDELQGKFSFVGALGIRWNDYNMQWDPNMYGGLTAVTLPYLDVWVPELTLSTPSDKASTIGKSTDIIRFDQYSNADWLPSSLFQSTCSVNAKYYPFDIQRCTTSFVSLGYKNYEVFLNNSGNIDFSLYSDNALWTIEGSETSTRLIGGGVESEIVFTVSLRRKSPFVIINLLLPILILCLLNAWVFLLVPESGERIGYCITTLLAIAVYMTIVSDTLPEASEPVPLISYKLFVDFLSSVLIVLVTILNMRLGNRGEDDAVPDHLQSLYRILTRVCCKGEKVTPQKEHGTQSRGLEDGKLSDNDGESKHSKTGDKADQNLKKPKQNIVTWRMISSMVDWIAFTGFSLTSLLNFFIFVAVTLPTK